MCRWRVAGDDVGKQLSQIQNLIAQKVEAIIVNPVDTDVYSENHEVGKRPPRFRSST